MEPNTLAPYVLKVLAEHQSKPTDVIDDATRAIMFGDKQFAKR